MTLPHTSWPVSGASPSLDPGRVDDLVLARLAGMKRAPAHHELARAIRCFAPTTHDDARWSEAIAGALARLQTAGLIDPGLRLRGGSTVAARFGAGGTVTWKRITERIVPGLALGVRADDTRAHRRLSDRDAWAAAIAARSLGLWTEGPPPTKAAVCDAVVWRALGLAGDPKRTPPEIRAHFLAPLLGGDVDGPPEKLLRMIAARQLGAARADLRGLREALGRRWLCAQEWRAAAAEGDVPEAAAAAAGIEAFAAAVRRTAAGAVDGLFGDRKVFIASVWNSSRRDPTLGALSLDEFKHKLVEAHRAGLVALVRADLVGAMDPQLVAASETRQLGARYHFVEREGNP